MSCSILVSTVFGRSAKKLAKRYKSFREDFVAFISNLKENPFAGTDLGHGLRKVRMAVQSKGKGKSGGVRIITYLVDKTGDDVTIELLDIYDKSEVSTLSDKELRGILKRCGL
ncbi:MAG: addiction module toxin RelE [Bacteroidaceae bacterium]